MPITREFCRPMLAVDHLKRLAEMAGSGGFWSALSEVFTLEHYCLETKNYAGRKTR